MATDFGLERFDGKKFKHFQRKDYPKLFRNDFHGVDYYRDKVIISGNNGMLMEYDIERDDFYKDASACSIERKLAALL